jgi:uncharacterized membrane protein YvbJ
MKCPHCEKEIPGKTCPDCGATTPGEARYCMECGSPLDYSEKAASAGEEENPDFENRILCPDGTCTGIIVDGICTECGKTFSAEELSEEKE